MASPAVYSCIPATSSLMWAYIRLRRMSSACPGGARRRTIWSNTTRGSIIHASRRPDATPACARRSGGTGEGACACGGMPSACARRRAGSIVSTSTLRPIDAACSASAADEVVLPTPPAPQRTSTFFVRRMSSSCEPACAGAFVFMPVPKYRVRDRGCVRKTNPATRARPGRAARCRDVPIPAR